MRRQIMFALFFHERGPARARPLFGQGGQGRLPRAAGRGARGRVHVPDGGDGRFDVQTPNVRRRGPRRSGPDHAAHGAGAFDARQRLCFSRRPASARSFSPVQSGDCKRDGGLFIPTFVRGAFLERRGAVEAVPHERGDHGLVQRGSGRRVFNGHFEGEQKTARPKGRRRHRRLRWRGAARLRAQTRLRLRDCGAGHADAATDAVRTRVGGSANRHMGKWERAERWVSHRDSDMVALAGWCVGHRVAFRMRGP
mmetsp:Transcript_34323/g.118318  ORF Transcript_34323/g.118318 Transcript_34323/m.118318 type:complete len:253 (+) Transcript_34323:2727-3485(+)